MRTLIALYNRTLIGLVALVCLIIVLAMVFVCIDVIARYFFNSPLAWVFEITEYFMLYAGFLGMAWLAREDRHVRIDLVLQALQPRGQAILDLVCSILAMLACGIAAYYAAISTYSHFVRDVMTIGLYPIPKWTLIACIWLGFALTTIEFAARAYRRWRELRTGNFTAYAGPPIVG